MEHHLCILEPSVHTVLPCGVGCRGEEGGGEFGALGRKGEGEVGRERIGGVDWRHRDEFQGGRS